jgi:NAD(P)-dependent dehydrogenase (short-subunit alcohol dehydrogenase family)
MQGKTVVVTGGTSGATLGRLRKSGPGLAHCVHLADLTQLAEMKRVAGQIAAEEPRIDVLINNAGALFGGRRLTPDGLERTFALNHMAYFVITKLLRERIVASAPARIVSTASGAHEGAVLDLDDLQSESGYSARKAYSRSKLCNILFTRELARRLKNTGGNGKLSASGVCRHPVWRSEWRHDLEFRSPGQVFCDIS